MFYQSRYFRFSAYKHISSKQNSNTFPICCGLLVVSVCTDLVEAHSVSTGTSYPLAISIDRILCSDCKSKYYSLYR